MQNSGKPIPNLSDFSGDCCGCSACMTACPVKAISMEPDERGFLRPVILEKNCLRCGKCLQVCAFKKDSASSDTDMPLAIYAVRAKDMVLVNKSSSGGVFTLLSDEILRQGGAVASAVYDYESHSLRYRLYSDQQTRDAARGSKYIHPVLGNIYDQCLSWMRQNPQKPLLFVGVGCHCAGFLELLNTTGLRHQAIVADLICHGTPSPQLWTEYVHSLEQKYQGHVEHVNFKDKRNGWENPYAYVSINNQEIPLSHYSYWFYESFSQRQSCFQCPYTKLHRSTDLTIGDFWGVQKSLPELYSNAGTSLVIIQTETGAKLFESIKDEIDFAQTTATDCLQPRLESPGKPNPKQLEFWQCYQAKGIPGLIKHYHEDGKLKAFPKMIIHKGKRLIHRLIKLIRPNMF